MRHASLFSGIGGFDLAAEWMGWENVFNCEIDPFCKKVLKHHFPQAKQYGDIKDLTGSEWKGRVDVLTGGFPCQPFSAAGKRRGTDDDRHLWPEMLRVIQELQPSFVVAENVRGILTISEGLVFEGVCSDLEANGYEVQPFCIPACAVGAPHRRDRMWFVAHLNGRRLKGQAIHKVEGNGEEEHHATGSNKHVTDSEDEQCKRRESVRSGGRKSKAKTGNGDSNATNSRCEHGKPRGAEGHYGKTCKRCTQAKESQRCGEAWHEPWVQVATRLCRLDDGLPDQLDGITIPKWRRESLKAYGNAIVPQVAYNIFQSLSV